VETRREALIQVFKRSKLGVVALLPTPNHLESLPIKMFEYMGAGLPVIASDFPLWKQIVEENECGICVNPKDPNDILRGIKYLLENPQKADEMGKKGREIVLAKYNWNAEAFKLVQLYHQLAANIQ
jgi:glycosyltransferase involved in cell wall biosynthesis